MNYDISSQMDFLVKSAGGNTYEFVHFDQVFDQLAARNTDDDRMALISFLFFKLNVQLNSRYINDGIERIKKILKLITRQLDDQYIPSSYCRYCKFERVCKMRERGSL